jgi:hypothetical protein
MMMNKKIKENKMRREIISVIVSDKNSESEINVNGSFIELSNVLVNVIGVMTKDFNDSEVGEFINAVHKEVIVNRNNDIEDGKNE